MPKKPPAPPAANDWEGWRDYLCRPRDGWKHDPNSWQTYLTVHEGRLRQFPADFLLSNLLKHDWQDVMVLWEGDLLFADGLKIHVQKNQIVQQGLPAGPHVQTDEYSYQVASVVQHRSLEARSTRSGCGTWTLR